ncbi:MAG: Arginine--tRNA ligase [candidate division WS2 bacterium ADurb.Bin280]|uniref:Arginine--tRNA ligase n=1 Tax=candidate division WS2 bacterium ADurb.Bin280 TaxID=1852829 RepID=A0A1V5SF66_9BACT|nr:MAG: Arginine--tRNA ligase [candidate division WS2 bacterium ADurb.Bin280]
MIKDLLAKKLSDTLDFQVELSSSSRFGDICLPPALINDIVDKTGKTGEQLFREVEAILSAEGFVDRVEYIGGFINLYLSKKAYLQELGEIINTDSYLYNQENSSKTVIFDYSSPNIAKPFSVGHLRSTIIGQANYNIHKSLGYQTVGINHIGDWGTQFGKLIVAIKKWGDEGKIKDDPITQLNELYVKFHAESEKDPSLEDEARAWFKKLENGDDEARTIWQMCVNESFKEFKRIYGVLGVEIDEVMGESVYEDKLEEVVEELERNNLLQDSQGAKIVEIEGMPPALIKKKDGATLYITRDLSAVKYRMSKYSPEKIIYHVGNDQSLHFKQLEAIAVKLGWIKKGQIVFAGHGMIRLPEGKMSTRSGRVVLLDELIEKAKEKAMGIIDDKGTIATNVERLCEDIAISAIKYADLSQNRKSDAIFSFDKMISLKGNSSVYLQYTLSRINSIEKNAKEEFGDFIQEAHIDEDSILLAKILIKFHEAVENSAASSSPNVLADFTYKLANEFNSLYEKKKVIAETKEETSKNLFVVFVTKNVLEKCFDLLGVSKIERI